MFCAMMYDRMIWATEPFVLTGDFMFRISP